MAAIIAGKSLPYAAEFFQHVAGPDGVSGAPEYGSFRAKQRDAGTASATSQDWNER
jgi:hypothetical protein